MFLHISTGEIRLIITILGGLGTERMYILIPIPIFDIVFLILTTPYNINYAASSYKHRNVRVDYSVLDKD